MGCSSSRTSATDLTVPESPTGLPTPSRPQPQVNNVENSVIIWLNTAADASIDEKKGKEQLQQIASVVKITTDPSECLALMDSIKDEKIFFIVSGASGENFIPSIQDRPQIDSIYVFQSKKDKESSSTTVPGEIQGSYTAMLPLCKRIRQDIKRMDRDLIGFELVERSILTATAEKNQQEALFMYDQLFKEIVLAMTEQDMIDLYDFCLIHYRGNREEMTFLADFRKNYAEHSPVWWYTRDSFLYRILNKALRTHQYDTLYVLRVFIRHLHETIVKQQKESEIPAMTLYRGQGMEKSDFDRMRQNEGKLLSMSSFLSTSADRDVAMSFAREISNDRKKISVFMEIEVNKDKLVPFANIKELSFYGIEKEWLFSMGSVFRIGSTEKLSDGVWLIHLTLTTDKDEELMALRKHFKKSMEDRNSCLNLATLMHQIAAWKRSEFFYLMGLESETAWERRSTIFNNLGSVRSELDDYEQALFYYQRSLQLELENGGEKWKGLATKYNNIGTLYYKQKKLDLGIENFQKAITAYNAASHNDRELEATLYQNIASIQNDQEKHEEALKNMQKCLNIRINIYPPMHPSIASTYSSIATTFRYLHCYDQAIEYGQKAVDIDLRGLPPGHPQTQMHQHNLEIIKQERMNYK